MSGTQIIQPEVTIALANADGTVSNTPHKVLLVGQMTAAGSATSGALYENVTGSAGAAENALFGEDSMVAEMVRAFRRVNQVTQVDVIPLDDAGGGVARVVDFTIAGPSTAAGTVTVTVGSENLHQFEVAVASGDTPTDIAAAIVAAINADTKVAFTASAVAGAVTLTANNDGTVYNDLGVEVEIDAAGVTLGVAVTETTPGATDPTLTNALDNATGRYQGIVWPYADTSALRTFLEARFNPSKEILDGVGFVTIQDSLANALTTLNALNSQVVVYFVDEQITESGYLGPAMNEASFVKSTYFAAIRALRLTEDASISRFLTSSASLDQFGGPALASLPYFNTGFPDLPIIKAGRGWTSSEIEQLLAAGGSVIGVNSAGTAAIAGEVKTTFKTDLAANPDPTFGFLNYVDTSSQAREYFFNNLKARFAQSRLTAGAVTRGRDMANPTVIRAYLERLYQDLSGADFVLTQAGEEAQLFFKENVTIVLDLAAGSATITMKTPIVVQLRALIATMKIAFSTD